MRRTLRMDKMAAVYEDEILPLWTQRFGQMILRKIQVPAKCMVLDVGCGTGYTALEIANRAEEGRVIAIEPVGQLLDIARRKAGDLSHRRIFFRTENVTGRLGFADQVFDLVLTNLGLLDVDEPLDLLREFSRVAKVGGQVVVTMPLEGSYAEFHDIYREVLTKNDKHEILQKLNDQIAKTPSGDQLVGWMKGCGLTRVDLEVEEFYLLFKSSREFFFAPVIEYGPLSAWKEIAGKGEPMQDVFWHIKEAIDTYFSGSSFKVTIQAGCISGVRGGKIDETTLEIDSGQLEQIADEAAGDQSVDTPLEKAEEFETSEYDEVLEIDEE